MVANFLFRLFIVSVTEDLTQTYSIISPKIVFCNQHQLENVTSALANNKLDATVVVFDNLDNNLESFIRRNKGTQVGYRYLISDNHPTAS